MTFLKSFFGKFHETTHVTTLDVIIEWSEEDQVWITRVPALNHLSDFGATKEEALSNTIAAARLYLQAARDREIPVNTLADHKPEVRRLRLSTSL